MTSKLKLSLLILLSAGLGMCWYPLAQLVTMQIERSQLLFFAFAAASLLTISFMALQVESWRNNLLELLTFALTGGVSVVLVHYSVLYGNPIVALSLFCIALVAALFLDRLAKSENLVASEFLIILLLLMAAISISLANAPLKFDWSLVLATLSGVGFHRLYLLNNRIQATIPVMSKLAAIFIASTWLVGMVLIFSPRSASFPLENAAIFSALYGVVILVPIIGSIVFILVRCDFGVVLLWMTLMLSCILIGGAAVFSIASFSKLLFPSLLLLIACGVQISLLKKQFSSQNDENDHPPNNF